MLFTSPQVHLKYDGTFEGLLSIIFAMFELKLEPISINPINTSVPTLFDDSLFIGTDTEKAQRVWKAWVNISNRRYARLAYLSFLSDKPYKDMLICRYAKKLFSDKSHTFYKNMLDEDAYQLYQTARKVSHEKHRFTGFIRFQKTHDGLYYAPIAPDNNILRLLAPHFCKRFSSQAWIIYDVKRDFGLYYDLKSVNEIKLKNPKMDIKSGRITEDARHLEEKFYDNLWQHYYKAINIPERKNTRQMKRLMPVRYWKYLNEKKS